MPLMSKTVPLARFKAGPRPSPSDFAAAVAPMVFARASLDSLDPQRGVTALGDPLNTDPLAHAYEFGDALGFSIRTAKRHVPAAAVKMETARRVAEECRTTGKTYLPAARRREIKEQVTLSLTARAPWGDRMHDVIWLPSGEVWLCNPSKWAEDALDSVMARCGCDLDGAGVIAMPGFLDAHDEWGWTCINKAVWSGKGVQTTVRASHPDHVSEHTPHMAQGVFAIDTEMGTFEVEMGGITWWFKIQAPKVETRREDGEDPTAAVLEKAFLLETVIKEIDQRAAEWAEHVAPKAA